MTTPIIIKIVNKISRCISPIIASHIMPIPIEVTADMKILSPLVVDIGRKPLRGTDLFFTSKIAKISINKHKKEAAVKV
jgi:hypothetical protein